MSIILHLINLVDYVWVVRLDRNGLQEHNLGSYTVPNGNLELALSDSIVINFQSDNLRIENTTFFELLITFNSTEVTIVIF